MAKTAPKPAAQAAAPAPQAEAPAAPPADETKPAAQAAAPAVFRVVTHIKVDGVRLEPGDEVTLSPGDAARMLRSGSVAELDD